MDNIKVSIITVCFNAQQTIEQTITSVLNQTYKNIEYIIVDGASTDSTCQIIGKYQSCINKVISEKDEGLYYAMNKGISYAKGDIIGIVNSDDIYAEDAISKVVEYYQRTNADIIYGNAMWFDEEKEIGIYRCDDIEELWYRMAIPHPATFVRAAVYKKYGRFNTKYPIAADYELMLRFYCNHLKFGHIDEVITYFRTGGKSHQNQKSCIEDAKEIALYYIDQSNQKEYYLKKICDKYFKSYLGYFWRTDKKTIERAVSMILNSHFVKEIAIFGTGKWGKQMRSIIQNIDVKLEYFIDNDEAKQSRLVCGMVTKSPKFLKEYAGGVLIASSEHDDKIMEQIKKINNSLFILTLSDIGRYILCEHE